VNKMKQMWLLTAVLMVGVLAAGYFLLVSPKKGEVSKLHGQAATQRDSNDDLASEIKRLEKQATSLPAKQARLAQIQRNIPNNPAVPALVRSLTKSGRETGMKIEILEPSAPVYLDGAAVAAAPVAAQPAAKPGAKASDAPRASQPVAGAQVAVGKLAMVPIKITLWGSFAETEEFFSEIEKLKRTLMVTKAEIGWDPPARDNSNFSPGDLKVVIEARVFMRSVSPAAAKPATATAATSSETNE
jgi:Tfp pilus assembly protein PilO